MKYLKSYKNVNENNYSDRDLFNLGGSLKINNNDVKTTALYLNAHLRNLGKYHIVLMHSGNVFQKFNSIVVYGVLKNGEYDGKKIENDSLIIRDLESGHSYIFNAEKNLDSYTLNVFKAKKLEDDFAETSRLLDEMDDAIPDTNVIKIIKADKKIRDDDKIREITYLYLNNLGLKDVEGIKYVKSLTNLWLSNNSLGELGEVKDLTNLKTLNVEKNFIRNLDGIENLKEIISLYAHDNLLTSIKGVEKLKNLNTLTLYNNNLRNIDEIKKLPKLNFINAKNNNFSSEYEEELMRYCKEKGIRYYGAPL